MINRLATSVFKINSFCVFCSEKRENGFNFILVDEIKSLLAVLVFVLEKSYFVALPLRD